MDNEKNILLIHGFNGIPKIFYYFQKELEEQGYKVIIPNFPVREEININTYFKIFDIYRNIMNEDLISRTFYWKSNVYKIYLQK